MNGCMDGVYRLSLLCCLGGGPGIELIHDPGGPPCPCMVKKVCEPELIPSPDRSRLFKARVACVLRKGTYKGKVKLR